MLNVYLLRHGETTFNADGNRYCGRTDAELTEKGIRQAQRMAELLTDVSVDAVYASPLKRAAMTAEIAMAGRQPVHTDPRIIEVDFGAWEGKTRAQFIADDPKLWAAWNTDPVHTKAGRTGETVSEVIHRVDDFFSEMMTRHDNQTILVTAHNGVNRLYLAYKLGMPLQNYRRIVQDNSALTLIQLGGEEGFSLKKLNA